MNGHQKKINQYKRWALTLEKASAGRERMSYITFSDPDNKANDVEMFSEASLLFDRLASKLEEADQAPDISELFTTVESENWRKIK